jgi:hypothetical protein
VTIKLSKSKFVAGCQCLKRFYLQAHEPELAAEPDPAAEAIIEQGRTSGHSHAKCFRVGRGGHGTSDSIAGCRGSSAGYTGPSSWGRAQRGRSKADTTDQLRRNRLQALASHRNLLGRSEGFAFMPISLVRLPRGGPGSRTRRYRAFFARLPLRSRFSSADSVPRFRSSAN